jgi:ACS family hexuronate transporter-like MFS transporter
MTPDILEPQTVRRTLPRLRWWIGGLLFVSTVINYIDRQTLSVLAPFLKTEHHWTNADYASILLAFRLAYTIMQFPSGRILDRLGTRQGLTVTVGFYSVVAGLTSLAQGLTGFRFFRFLLGSGEAANWPGATKAVSEWFPARERAWAVALFDSGSSIGGAVAPFLVLFLYRHFGTWRPAFLVTASLGGLWLIAFQWLYRRPEEHPRISKAELEMIQRDRAPAEVQGKAAGWGELLRYRQTWGIILGRALLDPYWFLIAEWFPLYLLNKGFKLEQSVLGVWAPFLAADLGNFFGGALSSYWISRGWAVGKARRRVLVVFGPSMLVLIATIFVNNYILLVALFSFATFAYAACATMFLSLPADVFQSQVVASVSGLSGTAAGLLTLFTTYLIGQITDRFSFEPVIVAASLVPCIATVLLVWLVRTGRRPDPKGIMLSF